MTLQAVKGGLMIPNALPIGTTPAFASLLMDATGEKVAVVFRVPKTGTLDMFEWMPGTVTIDAATRVRCSFQDVSAVDGSPDGTEDQLRDMQTTTPLTTGTWAVPGLITSDGTDTGTKRSVTRGQVLAAVISYSTFTALDILNVQTLGNLPTIVGPPYTNHLAGAGPSWTKGSNYPVLALKYSDGTYEYLGINVWPIQALTAVTLTTATTPDHVGNIFSLPFPGRATGVWIYVNPAATGRDFDIVLYDADGTTELQVIAVDNDQLRSNAAIHMVQLPFDGTQELLADTNYRVVYRPTSASNTNVLDVTVNAAAIMDALPGGQAWHRTECTNAPTGTGDWTQTTTRRVLMGLLFDAFGDDVGGGGSINHSRARIIGG